MPLAFDKATACVATTSRNVRPDSLSTPSQTMMLSVSPATTLGGIARGNNAFIALSTNTEWNSLASRATEELRCPAPPSKQFWSERSWYIVHLLTISSQQLFETLADGGRSKFALQECQAILVPLHYRTFLCVDVRELCFQGCNILSRHDIAIRSAISMARRTVGGRRWWPLAARTCVCVFQPSDGS